MSGNGFDAGSAETTNYVARESTLALAPPVPQPPAAQPTEPDNIVAERHCAQPPSIAALQWGAGGAGRLQASQTSAVEGFHVELTRQLDARIDRVLHEELIFAAHASTRGRSLHFIVQCINERRAGS